MSSSLRRLWWRRLLRWLVALLVVAIGGPWLVVAAGSHGRMVDETTRDLPPVAIVLGAAVRPDKQPSRYLQARLDLARSLYDEGRVKVILVSGDGGGEHYDEPQAMRQYLVAHGVPATRIVEDPAGFDTWATCERARKVYGLQRAVLVSQGYHLPRAVTSCRVAGVDAVGAPDATVQTLGSTSWPGPLKKLGWGRFVLRERLTGPKMFVDWAGGSNPVLGPPSSAVDEALAR